MRSHGWQPPFHPLQTVAVVVFSALAFSFYVFFAPFLGSRTLKLVIIGVFTPLVAAVFSLYIVCTWLDPADPGVHRAQEKFHPEKPATPGRTAAGGYGQPRGETKLQSLKAFLATQEEGYEPIDDTGCQPLTEKLAEKSCCKRKREPDEVDEAQEQSLYCSICDAEISMHSKHCRACDKCVHGFDHHCRWLNNCVGSRNYKPFVALMVSCLLMLVLEWAVGIVVLVRCFSDETAFRDEIIDNLGRSFPRAAFIVVLIFLTFLALLATAPLTQLFCFHLILMHKGMTTYDYILAVREQNQEYWDEAGGLSTVTTTPATSTETGFSGYNSSGAARAGKRIVFCTPPRMFVDQEQTILALSDLEIGSGKLGGGKILDAKSSHQQHPAPVGLNPWKLARVRTSDAASAAARARQKSSILLPSRPGPGGVLTLSTGSSDSSRFTESTLSTSGEIRVAASVPRNGGSRKKFRRPGLRRELWSLTKTKRDRITPLSDEDLFAPRREGLYPLSQEPRSPYRSRSSSFSSDPTASYPPEVSTYPPQVLFPRYPGDDEKPSSFYPVSSPNPNGDPKMRESVSSVGGGLLLRASVNSDGYEASCGSGDDGSEVGGVSQSWTNASWSKFAMEKVDHVKSTEGYGNNQGAVPVWGKEENVKPWVIFSAGTEEQDVKKSPGCLSVSSGSRVEANILKANPTLRTARLFSPTTLQDSHPPELRESSDFFSEDTTSCCETPDRGTMSSFFYNGPLDASFKATSERRMVSHRRLMESILGSRTGMARVTDDPKLLVETP